MKKWKAYLKYKDSGVDWLGQIPEGWDLIRLKFLASEPLKYGANESADNDDRLEPRFIRITDIKEDGSLDDNTYRSLPYEIAEPYLLQNDDILLARTGATVGKSFIYSDSWGMAAFAGYLLRLRVDKKKATASYLIEFFQSEYYWKWISSDLIQATIQNFSAEKYNNIQVPVPPLAEQKTIAAFLDKKTEQIDRLLAKKKALIERLNEKRTALITESVTGRNLAKILEEQGSAKHGEITYKDSGVEWLGQIPEGWEVRRIDHIASVKARLGWKGLTAAEYVQEGYIFLATPNIKGEGAIDFENVNFISEERYLESPEIMLELGDVLLAKDGSTLGTVNRIRSLPSPATVNSSIAVIRATKDFLPEFLFRWLSAHYSKSIIDMLKDGQGVPHLFQSDIKKIPVFYPPLSEQKAIAAFLYKETEQIDILHAKVQSAIEKLTEYRGALINAAVTGKVDVAYGSI